MSDPLTQSQFYAAMVEFRKEFAETFQASHARLREDMNTGFRDMGLKFDSHEREDRAVEKRVTRIEEQREAAAKEITSRTTWIGILVPAAMVGLVEALKRVWK